MLRGVVSSDERMTTRLSSACLVRHRAVCTSMRRPGCDDGHSIRLSEYARLRATTMQSRPLNTVTIESLSSALESVGATAGVRTTTTRPALVNVMPQVAAKTRWRRWVPSTPDHGYPAQANTRVPRTTAMMSRYRGVLKPAGSRRGFCSKRVPLLAYHTTHHTHT